jgi:hypothetical protein
VWARSPPAAGFEGTLRRLKRLGVGNLGGLPPAGGSGCAAMSFPASPSWLRGAVGMLAWVRGRGRRGDGAPASCDTVELAHPPTLAATFGCLLAPLTFSIAKKLGASSGPAFLAGCFCAFDMMNVLESRHILVDSQLMFYCALCLWLALRYWKQCQEEVRAPCQCAGARSVGLSVCVYAACCAWESRWCVVLCAGRGRLGGAWCCAFMTLCAVCVNVWGFAHDSGWVAGLRAGFYIAGDRAPGCRGKEGRLCTTPQCLGPSRRRLSPAAFAGAMRCDAVQRTRAP